jgi:preprotein translocase subunit SecG
MILYSIALVIHIVICVALVLVILAQNSKGGLDANLGGAAMNVFGGSGASKFLKRWTQILGVVFVGSCLLMAFLVKDVSRGGVKKDVLKEKFTDTETPAKAADQPQQPTPQQGN